MAQRRGAQSPTTQKDSEMAINFEREAQLHRENLDELDKEPHRSRRPDVPVSGLIHTASLVGQHLPAPSGDEHDSATSTATRGFVSGFSQEMSAASPIGGLAQIAEAAEQGIVGQPEHLDRFPELRDVEMATGNAARFPELGETPPRTADREVEDDGYSR